MIAAGRLTKRVSIKRRIAGDAADTWEHVGTVWAEVKPISGDERYRAGETESDVTHKVTMRRAFDVLTRDQIRMNGRVFDIKAVRNLEEENSTLEIDAVEAVAP